jgi:DNA-binding transcriptional MerR regulator
VKKKHDWSMTVQDLTELLGDVSAVTIRRWAQHAIIPAKKNGFGDWRFNAADWPHSDPRRA